MNLKEFSKDLSEEFGIPEYIAKRMLSFLTKKIRNRLLFGVEITLREMGTFRLKVRKPKKYMNLQTGKWCMSEKHYYLDFVPTQKMKLDLKKKIVH